MGLSEQVKDKTIQANIAADCTQLIEEQVSTKHGLSGLALKATYGMVKGVGPTYIPGAIGRLLPDACSALEPIWEEGLQSGNPVEHLTQHRERAADMLLSVTDARIAKSDNGIVKGAYSKLRKSVKGDVEAAVPGLAKILDTHLPG